MFALATIAARVNTPQYRLENAIKQGKTEIVKQLLRKHSSLIHLRIEGKNIILFAAQYCHNPATMTAIYEYNELQGKDEYLFECNHQGNSSLHLAALNNNFMMLQTLMTLMKSSANKLLYMINANLDNVFDCARLNVNEHEKKKMLALLSSLMFKNTMLPESVRIDVNDVLNRYPEAKENKIIHRNLLAACDIENRTRNIIKKIIISSCG